MTQSLPRCCCRGGVPGAFPDFSDHKELVPHPVPFNLYDPFGLSKNKKPEKVRRRRLFSEEPKRLLRYKQRWRSPLPLPLSMSLVADAVLAARARPRL